MHSKGRVGHELLTYICVGAFVGSRTGEADELMAPFMDHKTAH